VSFTGIYRALIYSVLKKFFVYFFQVQDLLITAADIVSQHELGELFTVNQYNSIA